MIGDFINSVIDEHGLLKGWAVYLMIVSIPIMLIGLGVEYFG